MRLNPNPQLGQGADVNDLKRQIQKILADAHAQVNGLSDGAIDAQTSAASAAPTTGTHKQGDFVRNSAPTSGSPVLGWLCVASGTPGTWLPIQPGTASSDDYTLARSIFMKIIACWERNETSGTVMEDSHINGLDGTYSGLTVNQTGLAANLDKAVAWPAGNNYAEVPDNPLLSPLHSMCCVVWVKRNGVQGNFPKLMWKPGATHASGHASYLLQQDNFSNGGKVIFRITSASGGINYDCMSSTALADATPYMLVGNRIYNEMQIWVNGTLEQTDRTNGSNAASQSTEALRFGYHGAAADNWIGSQDQAWLFNSYLTPAEIAYLYNAGAGRSYATVKSDAGF